MNQSLFTVALICGAAGLANAQGDPAAEEAALAAALASDAAEAQPAPTATLSSSSSNSNPDISLILDTAAAWFSEPEPRQLGDHDPQATGFGIEQLELHMSANVDPFLRLDANMVFSPEGVEIEEAYATTLALPGNLQARAGLFLTRFGRLNPTHPHSWDFLDQPLINGKFFGPEGSRGEGLELSWLANLPWFVELIGAVTTAEGEGTARSFLGDSSRAVEGLGDLLFTGSVQQFFAFNPSWSLKWGLSAQFGPNPTGRDTRTQIYGSDLYLRYRPVGDPDRMALTLTVEGMYRTRQVPDDRLEDYGGYGALVWTLNSEWQVGLRQDWVSGLEDDPLDPLWIDAQRRTTAQVSYFPSHFSRLRLQLSHDAHQEDDVNPPVWAAMLGLEVVIGAHGAHSF